jgi:nucleoid-associated protein Lsr2
MRRGCALSLIGGDYDHFMAQRIQTLLIDDLDGGEAAGTVRFGLDGTEYEIDLSAAHSDEMRKALGQYLAHARRTSGTARSAPRSRRGSATVDSSKVRDWAKGQGIEVKDRGRVPADVVKQYKTAAGA